MSRIWIPGNCHWQPRVAPVIFPRMSDAAAPAQPPSKAKVFLRRLITTVILWTVILAALFSGNALISDGVFILLIFVLALAGLAEFYGLVGKRGLACFKFSRPGRRRAADGRERFCT